MRGRRVVVAPPVPALLPAYASLTDPVADLRAACLAAVAWLGPDVEVVADDEQARRVGAWLLGARGGFETGAGRPPQPPGGGVGRPPQPPGGGAGRPPQPPEDGAGRPPRPPGDESVAPDLLVLANGSACRSEKAPGHLDERAGAFDAALGRALADGDLEALARLDPALAEDLLAAGVAGLAGLAARGLRVAEAEVDHADDPFGVMYWVVRWQCES
jgi:hypothetical protein